MSNHLFAFWGVKSLICSMATFRAFLRDSGPFPLQFLLQHDRAEPSITYDANYCTKISLLVRWRQFFLSGVKSGQPRHILGAYLFSAWRPIHTRTPCHPRHLHALGTWGFRRKARSILDHGFFHHRASASLSSKMCIALSRPGIR